MCDWATARWCPTRESPPPTTSTRRSGRGERLALLDDVRREHLGAPLAGVLRRVHRSTREVEAVAGLEVLHRLALDLERDLALEDVGDLLARMRVLAHRTAGLEVGAREHHLIARIGAVMPVQLDALEARR